MGKSVFSKDRVCWKCGGTNGLSEHHIFMSSADRPVSERLGLKLYLCQQHHSQVHKYPNQGLDLILKQMAQKYYEDNIGDRDQFRKDFRKSYL